MAKMSYCRFENTLSDLADCQESLSEKSLEDLSDSEKQCAKKLIKMRREIADDFGDEL